MTLLLPLLQLAGFVWVFLLPGILLVRGVAAPWSAPVRVLVGAATGLLAMPMACFCVACVLRTSITPVLTLAVATVVNAGAVGVLALRARRRGASEGVDG